jgi:hypothetical protein
MGVELAMNCEAVTDFFLGFLLFPATFCDLAATFAEKEATPSVGA